MVEQVLAQDQVGARRNLFRDVEDREAHGRMLAPDVGDQRAHDVVAGIVEAGPTLQQERLPVEIAAGDIRDASDATSGDDLVQIGQRRLHMAAFAFGAPARAGLVVAPQGFLVDLGETGFQRAGLAQAMKQTLKQPHPTCLGVTSSRLSRQGA